MPRTVETQEGVIQNSLREEIVDEHHNERLERNLSERTTLLEEIDPHEIREDCFDIVGKGGAVFGEVVARGAPQWLGSEWLTPGIECPKADTGSGSDIAHQIFIGRLQPE
jgi:hypothetical protein